MNRATLLKIKAKAFDKQLEFLTDQSKRKVLFVPRRGAKTTAIAILFLLYAYMHDDIRLVFIGLTGENAENAFLPAILPILKEFDVREGIDYQYNLSERIFTFHQTNSTISLKGYDVSYKEMDKILGGKAFAVAIDECQSQTQDIEKAILFKIQPCVSDYLPMGGGIIILSGTAGDFTGSNFWYRICSEPNHLGWKMHTWEGKQNPYMLQAKKMEDQDFLERYGKNFEQLDWYRQQYNNEWITDGNRRVYHYGNLNLLGHPDCQTLPPVELFLHDATYILGMDFGYYPDPMAFVIGCYNLRYSDKLFIIDCFQATEMLVGAVDRKIRELDRKYHFSVMVADAGAQAKAQVADLNQTYGHAIIAADKMGKYAHQNMINSDLLTGQIVIAPTCNQLIDELSNLIWDPAKLHHGIRKEKDSLPNNLADALLYLHHYSRHQWYKAPKPKVAPADHFTQAILKGEKRDSRQEILNRNKDRLNPYHSIYK
jgi:hypothetical protein